MICTRSSTTSALVRGGQLDNSLVSHTAKAERGMIARCVAGTTGESMGGIAGESMGATMTGTLAASTEGIAVEKMGGVSPPAPRATDVETGTTSALVGVEITPTAPGGTREALNFLAVTPLTRNCAGEDVAMVTMIAACRQCMKGSRV